MTFLEFKKHKRSFEVNVFSSKNSKSQYQNIIDKDPNKLAQILLDLIILGFPIEKAVKIMYKKLRTRDWMGV